MQAESPAVRPSSGRGRHPPAGQNQLRKSGPAAPQKGRAAVGLLKLNVARGASSFEDTSLFWLMLVGFKGNHKDTVAILACWLLAFGRHGLVG